MAFQHVAEDVVFLGFFHVPGDVSAIVELDVLYLTFDLGKFLAFLRSFTHFGLVSKLEFSTGFLRIPTIVSLNCVA